MVLFRYCRWKSVRISSNPIKERTLPDYKGRVQRQAQYKKQHKLPKPDIKQFIHKLAGRPPKGLPHRQPSVQNPPPATEPNSPPTHTHPPATNPLNPPPLHIKAELQH